MSKGGVFAHFGSKEALQLATIAAARERFAREITEPLAQKPAGLAQLYAAFDLYFDYVAKRLPQGGCFFTASTLEMADRPGAVRDQIAEFVVTRSALIAAVLHEAHRRGEVTRGTDTDQLAFELGSLAAGAMVELQMFKKEETIKRARKAVRGRLLVIATAKARKLLVP
ncbi:MAG: transcriptional regulator, TetR family [Myxococcaceae bacterium]|nr:transcriptional regulator, TetR family [Myxococcaceae bacterium]